MMNKQLWQVFNKRVKELEIVVDYFWEHRREIVEKYNKNSPEGIGFYDVPELYVPRRIYNLIDWHQIEIFEGLLSMCKAQSRKTKKLILYTKKEVINLFLGGK